MIRDVHPASGFWFFTYPGSKYQKGTGSGSAILGEILLRSCVSDRLNRFFLLYQVISSVSNGKSSLAHFSKGRPGMTITPGSSFLIFFLSMRVWFIKKLEALWESIRKSAYVKQENLRNSVGRKYGSFCMGRNPPNWHTSLSSSSS